MPHSPCRNPPSAFPIPHPRFRIPPAAFPLPQSPRRIPLAAFPLLHSPFLNPPSAFPCMPHTHPLVRDAIHRGPVVGTASSAPLPHLRFLMLLWQDSLSQSLCIPLLSSPVPSLLLCPISPPLSHLSISPSFLPPSVPPQYPLSFPSFPPLLLISAAAYTKGAHFPLSDSHFPLCFPSFSHMLPRISPLFRPFFFHLPTLPPPHPSLRHNSLTQGATSAKAKRTKSTILHEVSQPYSTLPCPAIPPLPFPFCPAIPPPPFTTCCALSPIPIPSLPCPSPTALPSLPTLPSLPPHHAINFPPASPPFPLIMPSVAPPASPPFPLIMPSLSPLLALTSPSSCHHPPFPLIMPSLASPRPCGSQRSCRLKQINAYGRSCVDGQCVRGGGDAAAIEEQPHEVEVEAQVQCGVAEAKVGMLLQQVAASQQAELALKIQGVEQEGQRAALAGELNACRAEQERIAAELGRIAAERDRFFGEAARLRVEREVMQKQVEEKERALGHAAMQLAAANERSAAVRDKAAMQERQLRADLEEAQKRMGVLVEEKERALEEQKCAFEDALEGARRKVVEVEDVAREKVRLLEDVREKVRKLEEEKRTLQEAFEGLKRQQAETEAAGRQQVMALEGQKWKLEELVVDLKRKHVEAEAAGREKLRVLEGQKSQNSLFKLAAVRDVPLSVNYEFEPQDFTSELSNSFPTLPKPSYPELNDTRVRFSEFPHGS
ncbi:unnamed protein product [Closterium sp. Naga37s-1]|nr:unnamed protein product [Closterium sp. Naga37s-1]